MVVAEGLHLTLGGLYFQAGMLTLTGASEITQTQRGNFQTIQFHHTFNDVPILFTQVLIPVQRCGSEALCSRLL
jgi:hypothetical protein